MKTIASPKPKTLQTQMKIARVQRMKKRTAAWWKAAHAPRLVRRAVPPAGVMRQAFDSLRSIHPETV